MFVAAIGLQALALFKLNDGHGPGASYMALKMVYLAVYPLAVAASVACAAGWEALNRLGLSRSTWSDPGRVDSRCGTGHRHRAADCQSAAAAALRLPNRSTSQGTGRVRTWIPRASTT